jgi:hypothetical protein
MREILKKQGKGVLYFNTQHEPVQQKGFIEADGKNTFTDIRHALNAGSLINFLPSINKKIRAAQLAYLVNKCFEDDMQEFYFVIEEAQLYNGDREAMDAIEQIYTTGRKWGIFAGIHSVRPAIISNTIITQSEQKFIFKTDEFEMQYFKRYNLPYDTIMSSILQKGEYAFMIQEPDGLKGAFKI